MVENDKLSARISVIIPCYNMEQYIDRCLESVMEQTIGLNALEVIVVNDASTDHTLDKLKEWEEKYPNNIIVVTYEENMRQGGARNIGLQYASAPYIGYVDADDWIEPDMYEEMLNKMETGQYDVVKCKYIREHYQGEHSMVIENQNREDKEYSFTQKNGFYHGQVGKTGNCGEYGGQIWSGIYKKDMLIEHDIFFPEHLAYEDNYWGSILSLYVGRVYIIDKICYHYYINMQSTSTFIDSPHHFDRLVCEELKIKELKRRGALDIYYREFEWEFIRLYYLNTWHIFFMRFTYIPDIYGDMRRVIEELFPDWANNPYRKNVTPRQEQLLRMLEMKYDFTVEELERIKQAYINA